MFSKILIANRGEIACRIIRSAKKLGIKTVAICSDIDSSAPHVILADESINIGGNSSAESYLDIKKIIMIGLYDDCTHHPIGHFHRQGLKDMSKEGCSYWGYFGNG